MNSKRACACFNHEPFANARFVGRSCPRQSRLRIVGGLMVLVCLHCAAGADPVSPGLQIPVPGDQSLYILSPTLLELFLINTKQPGPAHVDRWDWIDDQGNFVPPDMSSVRVIVNGQVNNVMAVGFKRRPLYAPQATWDLRIANSLYLRVNTPVAAGQSVEVTNDGSLWPTNMKFAAAADPLRYNPAIHVNQEGYLPAFSKKAIVGYYIGNMGELTIPTNRFLVVNAQTGATVYEGTLTSRPDVGYTYTPTPYQNVFEADFTGFTTPGQRTRNGMRRLSSYMKRLSKRPWSPRKKPWSLV